MECPLFPTFKPVTDHLYLTKNYKVDAGFLGSGVFFNWNSYIRKATQQWSQKGKTHRLGIQSHLMQNVSLLMPSEAFTALTVSLYR